MSGRACRLLELRWADLEGEEGTGALEEDVVLMERANLSGRLLTAVTYRAQQKRAVREWVVVGRRALAYVMAEARVQNK